MSPRYSAALDPSVLGEHIAVPFEVRRLPHARLLWLNERWLIEAGFAHDTQARAEFAARMLRHFAVTSRVSDLPGTSACQHTLYADRYGGSGGALHGGSGRCGSKDGFIAKGIGKTPLVDEGVDRYHKNGRMSVAEATRETVNAEIANRELPWGAVPTVAIIDAGFDFPYGESAEPRRAAIVVRPQFIRPAHFERSIFFGTGGHRDSAQFLDALRVRDATRAVVAAPSTYPQLLEMFRRFAQQIGVARARRLWQGRFLSSNVSIDGALVDFGSFRAVPNWRRTIGVAGECFGAEIEQLRQTFLSVAGFFGKYAPQALTGLDPRPYLRELVALERASFLDACLSGFGAQKMSDAAPARELVACIEAYYRCQQAARTGVDVAHDCRWIHDAFTGRTAVRPGAGHEQAAEAQLLAAIRTAEASRELGDVSLRRAAEFFRPRALLTYDASNRRARRIERLAGRSDAPRLVQRYIAREIAMSLPPVSKQLLAVG
ncbi:MAG TPA: hypothetical protein VEW08_15420 [Steroidobacteraceae bacterium]|nr:hypothetical protein [Steroidobacteraceae bacterium]